MSHPILTAAADVRSVLKAVADVNPTFMDTDDKAAALRELTAAEAQVAELRLRVLAESDDLAATTGSRDAADWAAHHTRTRGEDARADLALASALDRRYPVLATALRAGEANLAQAKVVARCLDDLPAGVPADVLVRAEETLVGYTADFGPRQLARLGRRILDIAAPEVAEEAEARRLAQLEAESHRRTRLAMRRNGDGTTRLSALIPDAVATRLATYLEAFTNPRKDQVADSADPDADPLERLSHTRKLGQAFCQLLEVLDPDRLPIHGGDATTLVVTIGLDQLKADLASASLLGSELPGEDATDGGITADQARRLACTATLIPAVLGADSQVLDLGAARRLFNAAQRKALLLRDRICRAQGCDVSGAWCDAHHWLPWSRGGPTDLANAILLCRHHHQRAHDPDYEHTRAPDGSIVFRRTSVPR
ncbi:HNH endonuclease [Nocardioides rotundus]|uniref:HNH endonuclease signature motif containing protein n=1 Tax=Nocardioides rotundus TaxID=1774216 RepID=UPI001CBF0649|nr:HNH endonuclease signature motif containing protein [Nocardioides rotundus]UAL29021.1 HNH endonuclease [Nocardioides rotundus]